MKNYCITTMAIFLLALGLSAQSGDSTAFDFWQERYFQANSRLAKSSVFRSAAKSADQKAIQFLESWSQIAHHSKIGMDALQALGQISAYPFAKQVFELVAKAPTPTGKSNLLRALILPGPHHPKGVRALVAELGIHARDSHGLLVMKILSSSLGQISDENRTELTDTMLAIFEEQDESPLRRSIYLLSRDLKADARQRFDLAALLATDKEFALPAAKNLLRSSVEGSEELLVSLYIDDTPKFFAARLDRLLAAKDQLLLRIKFLNRADVMSWPQLRYLKHMMAPAKDKRLHNYLVSSLSNGNEKTQIMALWMIRDLKHKNAIMTLRKFRVSDQSIPVSMLLHDTLANLADDERYFLPVKKYLSEGKLDTQLKRLEIAEQIGLQGPFLEKWLSQKLKSIRGNWKIKGHLVRLAGTANLPDALSVCDEALESKRWQNRLAAIEALISIGSRPALIRLAGMSNDPQQRLARTASDGLYALTGVDLGANPDGWRRLIASLGRGWVPTRTPLHEARLRSGDRYAPQFYGLDLKSNRVIFVCDTSGSMQGRKIETLKTELWRTVGNMTAKESAFNAIFFDNSVRSIWSRLARLKKTTRAKAKNAIRRIQAGGGTNVWGAIEKAFADPHADTFVVLTDGQPSAGTIRDPSIILREVAKLNRYRRIQIHCVFLTANGLNSQGHLNSDQAASDFMQKLAKLGEGQYVEN